MLTPSRVLLTSSLLTLACNLQAQTAPLNPYARTHESLNGKWASILDPYDNGYLDYRHQPFDKQPNPTNGYFLDRQPKDRSELIEYNFDASPTLMVPGDWNSQGEKYLYYEGTTWYRRTFDYRPRADKTRVHLYFGAVNYASDVYLNGKLLGRHVGGFTPFSFEVTGKLKGTGNSLVVRVNNTRALDAVPTVNTDWWNYGGITRDVLLVETPETFIHDYHVQLKKGARDRIVARVQLEGAQKSQQVTVAIPEANLSANAEADANGFVEFELPATPLELWSPQHPRLYDVEISSGSDRITDRIGFRTI